MSALAKNSIWGDERFRSFVFQALVFLLVAFVGYTLFSTTQENLENQSIATGFEFLSEEASFDIGESLISYTASDSYGRAFLVGILNTLKVSVVGIILAVFLGIFLGISRMSSNWLVAKMSSVVIEAFRNTPLLLQLFFWYALLTEILPHPRQATGFLWDSFFLTNRGFFFPFFHEGVWSKPILQGFNFTGGASISPEFAALLIGLVLYTAVFIAEIVRAGILSVNKGQREAALALGLKPTQVLNLVILPQALRVIIPPLTSQMLNLIKNSSLALAIGYPDVVLVANTTLNQTGQAIEGIALIMAVYLFFSLVTSLFMNWYNQKVRLIEK